MEDISPARKSRPAVSAMAISALLIALTGMPPVDSNASGTAPQAAPSQPAHQHQSQPAKEARSTELVSGPVARFSDYPTPVIDPGGQLWLAFVEGDRVFVTRSSDGGKSFARATPVIREPESIDANGEGRPKIALGGATDVYVSWTKKKQKAYTGELRFSRSTDSGRTFSPPISVADDEAGQRFDTLAVSPKGEIAVAWVDKRDLQRETAAGKPYSGAAVYFALSKDRGVTFTAARKIKDNTCECCRLALQFDSSGRLVLAWRDIMPGSIRDHAIAIIEPDGSMKVQRVSFDQWKLDGCPHHGPSLSISQSGDIHLAWFTGQGPDGPGVYYSFVHDNQVSKALRFGAVGVSGRPAVIAVSNQVYVAWKEEIGNGASAVNLAISTDGGKSWSASRPLAKTSKTADQPFLVSFRNKVFLSWFTRAEGYRLIAAN